MSLIAVKQLLLIPAMFQLHELSQLTQHDQLVVFLHVLTLAKEVLLLGLEFLQLAPEGLHLNRGAPVLPIGGVVKETIKH